MIEMTYAALTLNTGVTVKVPEELTIEGHHQSSLSPPLKPKEAILE